jgi:hypothetical protein
MDLPIFFFVHVDVVDAEYRDFVVPAQLHQCDDLFRLQ